MLNGLAIACDRAGDGDRAGEIFRRIRDRRRASLGPDDPATLRAALNVAAWCVRHQRVEEAEETLAPTVEAMRRVLGPEHTDTAHGLVDLGILYRSTGRAEESLRALREAHAILVASLGPDNTEALSALDQIVRTLTDAGDLERALPLALELHDRADRALPPRHPLRTAARTNVADLWLQQDVQGPEALELLRQNLEDDRARLGPDHENVLRAMVNLASYADLSDAREAQALLREAVDRARRALGPDHPETLMHESSLAGHLIAHGGADEALALASHADEAATRTFEPASDEAAVLALRHGSALLLHGRFDEAEPRLLRAYEGLLARRHPGASLVRETAERLAELYLACGDEAEAERWRSTAERR